MELSVSWRSRYYLCLEPGRVASGRSKNGNKRYPSINKARRKVGGGAANFCPLWRSHCPWHCEDIGIIVALRSTGTLPLAHPLALGNLTAVKALVAKGLLQPSEAVTPHIHLLSSSNLSFNDVANIISHRCLVCSVLCLAVLLVSRRHLVP